MLVERTIHQGLRVLGDIYGVNGDLSGSLLVGLNLQVGTTTWLKGDTTIGVPPTNTTTLTVYGLISIPTGGYTTGLIIEKAIDLNIGANTEFDIDDEYFRFSDGTNTLRVDSSNNIQLLGQTGIGSTGNAAYKLLVTPDDNKVGLFIMNNWDYEPLQETWGSLAKSVAMIGRDTDQYGLNDYSAISFRVKPTASHLGRVWYGAYSDTPANHHAGFFIAASGNSDQTTIFKGSIFGDFHFQTESTRDVTIHISRDVVGTMTSLYVMGYNASSDSFKLQFGNVFTSTPAIEVMIDDTVKLNSLAGTGVRTVYADADGLLSALSGYYYLHSYGSNNSVVATPNAMSSMYLRTTGGGSNADGILNVDLNQVELLGADFVIHVFVHQFTNTGFGTDTVNIRDSGDVVIWTNTITSSDEEMWGLHLFWSTTAGWRIMSATDVTSLNP